MHECPRPAGSRLRSRSRQSASRADRQKVRGARAKGHTGQRTCTIGPDEKRRWAREVETCSSRGAAMGGRSNAPLLALLLLCAYFGQQRAVACELGYQTRLAGAAVHAGEPVAFRAHGAAAGPAGEIAYHFRFSSADTTAEATLSTGEAMSLGGLLTRAFEQGVHVATVYCRPAPAVASNGSGTVPSLAFWPLARARFVVHAAGVRFCYEYRVEQLPAPMLLTQADELLDTTQSVLLVSVWDKSEPTIERAAYLTAQFLAMRVIPSVQLSSMTKSGPAAMLPVSGLVNAPGVRDGWQIVVPEVYNGPMDATLELRMSPPAGLSLMGCSIAPSTVHVSRRRRSLPYGSPYAEMDVPLSARGVKVGAQPPLVGDVTLYPNPCRPSELTLLAGVFHNKLSLLLSNEFNVLRLDGTSRSFTRINDTAAWICAELAASGTTACPITTIHGALPLVSGYTTELLLNTREGVVHFVAASPTRPSATLTNLSTVVPGVHGDSLRMLATTHSPCADLRSSPAVCVYLISAQPEPAVWSSCAGFELPWHHQTFSSAASFFCGTETVRCEWQIDSAVRDFYRHADVYLASGSGQSLGTFVSSNRHADAAVSGSLDLRPGFAFSAPEACDGAVSSMVLHSNGHELIAYGRQIWTSADGGYAFHCLATLPNGETAAQVATTTFQSGFAVVSNAKRVYYGRTGVAHLAAVISQLSQYRAPIVNWTPSGVLLAFDVGSIGTTIDRPEISIHSVVSLPVDESVVVDDLSFECPLVPSWFVGNILLWCGDGVSCFSQVHLGRRIVMESGGSVQIVSIENGTTVSGIVVEALQPDFPATRRTRLRLSKIAGALIGKSAPECHRWIATLNESDSSSHWKFYDRGKTLMTHGLARVNRQSYLVSEVINDTHALLVQYSNVCPETGADDATFESGSWLVVDLRGYAEARAAHADQLELNATMDGTFVAIAVPTHGTDGTNHSTTSAELQEKSIIRTGATHLTFVTEDADPKWGVILSANASLGHRFQVQLPNWSVAPGTVVRVSRWSAFAVESMSAGPTSTPIFRKQRTWRLTVPPCNAGDISDPEAATRSQKLFRSEGGHWLGSTVRFVDLNQNEEFRRTTSPQDLMLEGLRLTRIHPYAVDSSVIRTVSGCDASSDSIVVNITLRKAPNRLTRPSSVIQFAPLPLALDSSGSAASLRCSIGAQTAIIFAGCQPNTKLVHADTTGRSLLGHTSLAPKPGRWTTLRKNYRPPSALGRAVPTSDNIYNADPAVPRESHFERYAISRDSGRFKQCLGHASRDACTCPAAADVHAQPTQLAVTDCVTEVFTVHFSVPFVLHLVVVLDSAESPPRVEPLGVRYELEELNGRTDFCINRTAPAGGGCEAQDGGNGDLGSASSARRFVVDPAASDAVIWGGGELYHFRVTVTNATASSLCEMETEFLVFVDALSMQPGAQYLVMSSTAMASVLAVLVVYVSNFRPVEV